MENFLRCLKYVQSVGNAFESFHSSYCGVEIKKASEQIMEKFFNKAPRTAEKSLQCTANCRLLAATYTMNRRRKTWAKMSF